jgi:aerobic-type carbon monoxide dehydrogenase small subunit (CoxS/CutS family)
MFDLNINGESRRVDVPPGTSLLTVLRDALDLTGAKYGCGQGECGACHVLLDGQAAPACRVAVQDAAGKAIVTIEGLARDGKLHPVQQAFIDEDAMQCGACTSGMVMAAVALLARMPAPGEDDIRAALAGHLCRCGVYGRAIRAVQRAVQRTAREVAP